MKAQDEEVTYPTPIPGEVTGVKYIYDSYFQESDNISHRTDWFLIFHAILFEAFFAAKEHCNMASDGIFLPFNGVELIINVLGIVISFYWFMTGIRTWKILWKFGGYMRENKAVGDDVADTHNMIYSHREVKKMNFHGWSKPSIVFLIIIPLLFILSWLLIYLFNFDFVLTGKYMLFVLAVIIIINVMANYEDNKMKALYGAKEIKKDAEKDK